MIKRGIVALSGQLATLPSTTMSSNPMHKTGTESSLDASESQRLPLELLISIFQFFVFDNRHNQMVSVASVSLVSRTIRAIILPLRYEVLNLDIRTDSNSPPVYGWDGRPYRHRSIAFLSWLLWNSSVAPRQHIKHLIFRHDSNFKANELNITASSDSDSDNDVPDVAQAMHDLGLAEARPEPNNAPEWAIEHVTVEFRMDILQLSAAGIRPRSVHHLSVSGFEYDAAAYDVFSTTFMGYDHRTRVYIRAWTQAMAEEKKQTPEKSEQRVDWREFRYITYRDLSEDDQYRGREVPDAQRGVFLVIELGNHLGFDTISPGIVRQVSSIVQRSERDLVFHVVLVCSAEESTSVAEALLTATDSIPIQYRDKVWISHKRWLPIERMLHDPHAAFARAVQAGVDPWDTGRRLVDF